MKKQKEIKEERCAERERKKKKAVRKGSVGDRKQGKWYPSALLVQSWAYMGDRGTCISYLRSQIKFFHAGINELLHFVYSHSFSYS